LGSFYKKQFEEVFIRRRFQINLPHTSPTNTCPCMVAAACCFQLKSLGKLEIQMKILHGRRPIKMSKMA